MWAPVAAHGGTQVSRCSFLHYCIASGVERTRSSGCVGLLSQLLQRLRQEAYVEQLAPCLRVKPAR